MKQRRMVTESEIPVRECRAGRFIAFSAKVHRLQLVDRRSAVLDLNGERNDGKSQLKTG